MAPDPKRRRWVKPAVFGLGALVVVVGGLGGGAYYWTQQQYYVASDNGKVAIFKGVNASFVGFHLSHVYSTDPGVAVSTLPTASQEWVRNTITATSLSDAQSIMHTLSVLGADCTALTTAPSASVNPTASGSVSASGTGVKPTGTTSGTGKPSTTASRTALPSPSPSPSASIAESNQLSAQCPGAPGTASGGGSS